MNKIVIKGGKKINGEIEISGAKNAAVAILPAAILASEGKCCIENVPDIRDVNCMLKILSDLGCVVERNESTVIIDSTNVTKYDADTEEVRQMRASYYLLGGMMSRFKECSVDLPGGCSIGVRPIDQHIKGFEAMGAHVEVGHGAVRIDAKELKGASIFFDVVSVGATINVMMGAVMAEGTTILENVAKEPHVVDVANFLNAMGADVKGAGTDVIRIKGVEKLHGCNYSVIPDQIEAGTYMIAAAACGEEVRIKNIIPKHMESISAKLIEMGVGIEEDDDAIIVRSNGALKGVNIKTLPYPGFPTDVQQPMSVLLSVADGRSLINESIWESRFKHLDQLEKMGAKAKVEGRIAVIDGVEGLTGAEVIATDLRAGAAMVIAGLIAEGTTYIGGLEHIDRGYPGIERKLSKLGAEIERISVE